MAINFPTSPSLNTIHSENGISWKYNGNAWLAVATGNTESVVATGSTQPRSLSDRFAETVNVKDFGAKGDGTTDDTAAINAAIDYCRTKIVDLTYPLADYIPVSLLFPSGTYSVSSLNFTNIRTSRNFHIEFKGSVLVGNTVNVPIVDMVGSRWLWFHDATIISDDAKAIAKSGIQAGNIGTETCGNNKFYNVQCLGNFSEAAFSNFGSETTQYYSCRFQNSSSTANAVAYLGDGCNTTGYTSLYATITRNSPELVSFTNNYFYSCQFRRLTTGSSIFLSSSTGWKFDKGCYVLAFTGAGVKLYSTSIFRHIGLTVDALFETNQGAGLDYCIEFTGDGTNSEISSLVLNTPKPHAQVAFIYNNTGALMKLPLCSINVTGAFGGNTPDFFKKGSGSTIELSGDITTGYSSGLNLNELLSFSGSIIAESVETIHSLPIAGSYTITGTVGGIIQSGIRQQFQDSWKNISTTSNEISPQFEFNTLSSTSIVNKINTAVSGTQKVTIRHSGSGSSTFTHNTSYLRNNSGADVVLNNNQTISYVYVSGDAWQQV